MALPSLTMASAHPESGRALRGLLALLLVGGVLGGSILLPQHLSSPILLMLVAAVLLAPVLLGVSLRQPAVGLVALVAASITVPFTVGTGSETSLNITVLGLLGLMALWILELLVHPRRVMALATVPVKILLGMALVVLLAFLAGSQSLLFFAQTAPLRAQFGQVMAFLLSFAALILAADQVRDLVWLKRLVLVFLSLGGVYILALLVPPLATRAATLSGNLRLMSLFWTWFVALAFSQAVFNEELSRPVRGALLALILAAFYLVMLQNRAWSSGWLPALVAILAIVWVAAPRLALPASMLGVVLALLIFNGLVTAVMVGDNEYSLSTRLEAWRILIEVVKVNPLLGLGPANYYWYTPLFPILGYSVKFLSHNNYVDIAAQLGLVGLACYLWFLVAIARLGLKLSRRAMPTFARAYVYGALGGLAGMAAAGMLGDWVIPFVYNIGLRGMRASALGWIFLGGLIALEQILDRASEGEVHATDYVGASDAT